MENTTFEFLAKFNQLEKICNDIYGEKHGVTLYINGMQSKQYEGLQYVESWTFIFDKLKRCRHLRNIIVHENETFFDENELQEGIEFMQAFYESILSVNDPLSLLKKQEKARKEKEQQRVMINVERQSDKENYSQIKLISGIICALFAFILTVIIICIII